MSGHERSTGATEWQSTPLGQYLLEREQAFFDAVVANVFGYNAFQLGLPHVDFMRASRIPLRLRVDRTGPVGLDAEFHELPIASNTVDLLLLPHTLEFHEFPHQILREVARVLRPEGHVVIAGFNPWSLWGARRAFGRRRRYPWTGRFITLPRMKDWLALLGLEIAGGQMSAYAPPCATRRWLERLAFMDAAGDRWWPIAGGVYCLQAVKRVHGMRLLMPSWKDRLVPGKALAPVPEKARQAHDAVAARAGENS